jgi:hypothetical protein
LAFEDPRAVIGFTIAEGKIVEIDAISDPQRLPTIAAAVLANGQQAIIEEPDGDRCGPG